MQTLGELRTADGHWLALVLARSGGTFDFRVFRLDAQAASWVEEPGQAANALATETEALSEVTTRFPQFVGQSYRQHPLEDPPETPEAVPARGRQALLSAVALAIGIAFLYLHHFWPGVVFLSVGCLGLGWSIGGYDGGSYGSQ